jgi:hypothetical protein
MRLGKQEYVHDPRTLQLANFVQPTIAQPTRFDFDYGRRDFPHEMWGNDEWGDCVLAGRANHTLRLERLEQRHTVPMTNEIVVNLYKQMTGAQSPGDSKDEGLVVLDAMRQWKNEGWNVGKHHYEISAYGELDPSDGNQLRLATYALQGIHLGFWLPLAAQSMGSVWDYNGQYGYDWRPGSWGGHLVYSKRYDAESIYVITWGREVKVTNSFIQKYCDEAWAVADNLDTWRARATIDVTALQSELRSITSNVDG